MQVLFKGSEGSKDTERYLLASLKMHEGESGCLLLKVKDSSNLTIEHQIELEVMQVHVLEGKHLLSPHSMHHIQKVILTTPLQ